MRNIIIPIVFFLFSNSLMAQVMPLADTVLELKEAVVTAYFSRQPLLQSPTSVGILEGTQIRSLADETLLPVVNFVPGVRMEERSPGSYRLSQIGSLLRSPFGVRNVKIYIDEFPLTDAGENSYLNLLGTRSIDRMEILKGPDGSLFGANSGGVVLIDLVDQQADSSMVHFGISGGSYGLVHQNVSVQKHSKNSLFNLEQSFLRSDGYRENSAMRRHFIQASERWNYNKSNELKVLGFYANLDYRTPGGLNEEQHAENSRQARPAAGSNPGAVEQKARIENETFFGGISHESNITSSLRHVAEVITRQA